MTKVKLQKSIEDWYNSTMDRVSGWYKRRTQMIIFSDRAASSRFSQMLTASSTRKDSARDASLRQSAVAFAEATAKKDTSKDNTNPIDQIKTEIGSLEGVGLPIGWAQHPVGLRGVGSAIYEYGLAGCLLPWRSRF